MRETESREQTAASFILACVCEPGVRDRAELGQRAAQLHDWSDVVELADDHRVTNLVLRAVRSAGVSIRSDFERELADSAARSVAENMVVDLDLWRALSAFRDESIRVMALKGPGLARTVYEVPSLRPYDDIDLAVQAVDMDRVSVALGRAGFIESPTSDEATATSRDFVSATQSLLELHGDLLQTGLAPKCDADRWRRAISIPGLPGAEMLALEDQVVHLSIHAHKHGFNRLIWLKDLDMVIRTGGGGLDWDLVDSVSHREEVRSSVWLALDFASTLLGTPVPAALLRSMKPAAATRLLYRLAWPPDDVRHLHGRMRRRAVQLNESESWRGIAPSALFMGRRVERVRMLARHLAGSAGSARRNDRVRRPTSG
jgi:hypothetical protein